MAGFYDFAFFSWNYNDIKVEDLHAIFRQRFYSPALSDASFEFQDLLEQALVFWETALIEKGQRNNYPENIDLIELPDSLGNGKWSERYREKINHAKEEILRQQVIKNKIEKAIQVSRRNEYSLMLMDQINELQIYPSGLLLLLEKYDNSSTPSARQSARKLIK